MSNEPNKPIEAEELTEKELEGVVGGATKPKPEVEYQGTFRIMADKELRLLASVGCVGW